MMTIINWFPCPSFFHTSKLTGYCVFKFFWRSVDRKHVMHFQSQTSVFKFRIMCILCTPPPIYWSTYRQNTHDSFSVVSTWWPQENQHDWWSFFAQTGLIDGYGIINRCFVSQRNKWRAWTPQQWHFFPRCQNCYSFKSVATGNGRQVKVTQLKFKSSKRKPTLIRNI